MGRFIPNPPNCPYVDERIRLATEARDKLEVPVVRSEADMHIDEGVTDPTHNGGASAQQPPTPTNMHQTTFGLDNHATPPKKQSDAGQGMPSIDAKPQIRVRNPPGGKSSIQF